MRLGNCGLLATGPLQATWYRAIQPQFLPTALATFHTKTIPSRFSAGCIAQPGFEILYLAEDQQVALFEVQALLGSPLPPQLIVPNPASAWVVVNVAVTLSNVADLCDVNQQHLVDMSVQELTGDWRGYMLRALMPPLSGPYWSNVPTQRLGAEVFATNKIEGFTTYSAKVPVRKNLVIFPDRLAKGSQIKFTYTDQAGRKKTFKIP